jgi:dihydrofolate reductase
MGRMIVSAQMTIDGVMDSIEGWFVAEGDHDDRGFEQLVAADAVLLGRETYEQLREYWTSMTDDRLADHFNPIRKYVASRTLNGDLGWNASVIDSDVADAVARLREELDGDLLMYGCGGLAGYLVERGVVDEVRLWVHPVVWGDGVRVFHGGDPVRMRVIDVTPFESGVTLVRYQPEGAA